METKIKFDLPKEKSSIIKVVGVGGGGGNAVNHMYNQGIKGVDFIICNTDAQALEVSPIPNKIQLGSELTEGRGAGSNPEVGRKAAMESIEEIVEALGVNTKMLFITAGMGGGTGTGAAPIIAKTAKEMGILTVGIVTTPFNFEGRRRRSYADEGTETLASSVDCLLVINNDKIKEIYGNMTLTSAFSQADDILTIAARGIAEIITVTGYINVDFEDVKTVMTDSGVAIMGSATAGGDNRALKAVQQALASPLLSDSDIRGAKYILLNITSGTQEVLMDEITEITDFIQDEAGLTADMIWGNCFDESLEDQISVTIIATGFDTKENRMIINSLEGDKVVHNLDGSRSLTHEEEMARRQVQLTFNAPTEASLEPEEQTQEEPEIVQEETAPETQEVETDEPTGRIVSLDAAQDVEENIPELSISKPEATPEQEHAEEEVEEESELSQEEEEERIRRIKARIMEMRNLNLSINSQEGLNDLEKEPAFVRRKIKLDDVPHSSESQVSKFTLSEDGNEEKKPEIKSDNSFLHDNVD